MIRSICSSLGGLVALGLAFVAPMPVSAQEATTPVPAIYTTPFEKADGTPATLESYAGKVLLIVNTASRCGFTGQYSELEAIHREYAEHGLVVVAFPSNDFGGQEPGTNEEIQEFCRTRFKVTFPVMGKMVVKGDEKSPLYELLTGETSPFPGEIGWNFVKFVVDRQGNIVGRFSSRTSPTGPEIRAAIESAL